MKAEPDSNSKPWRRLDSLRPEEVPAFYLQHRHDTWMVGLDYQMCLRLVNNLAAASAKGVRSARQALDELARATRDAKKGIAHPVGRLFNTAEEWRAFLNAKLAEWAARADPDSARSLLTAVACAIRAAKRGEADADRELTRFNRTLGKLRTAVAPQAAEGGGRARAARARIDAQVGDKAVAAMLQELEGDIRGREQRREKRAENWGLENV